MATGTKMETRMVECLMATKTAMLIKETAMEMQMAT